MLKQLRRGGIHFIRQDFRWDLIQPVRAKSFSWRRTDLLVTAAANNHISILAILDYTPSWANGGVGPYSPPTNDADFANFAKAVVKRYGAGGSFWRMHRRIPTVPIQSVEIWNEPWEHRSWVNPDPIRYAQMVRDISTAVRSVAQSTKILISLDDYLLWTTPTSSIKWDSALLESFPDIASYVDVASIHLYFPITGIGPASFQRLLTIDSSCAAAGLTIPLWVTETNVSATDISAGQLGAPAHTIVPAARVLQAAALTSILDTLNTGPFNPIVQRVYAFSDFRTATMGWSSSDPVDSGLLLEGPRGTPMPALTALFRWAAANRTGR